MLRRTKNRKRSRAIKTLYEQVHYHITKKRQREKWVIVALIIGLLVLALIYALTSRAVPLLEKFYLSITLGGFASVMTLLVVLATENFSRTAEDSKFIEEVLRFLNDFDRPQVEIDTLDKRAEIGISAGQIRTLFPILAIPILIPIAVGVTRIVFQPGSTVSVYGIIYLIFGLAIVGAVFFSFLLDLD